MRLQLIQKILGLFLLLYSLTLLPEIGISLYFDDHEFFPFTGSMLLCLALGLMLVLVFAKMAAMSLTVSSGGSGGIFAPSLFVGAMLGGFLAALLHQPSAAFVIVGMAAVFAGAARVPIATLLMVTAMTGGYQLLVPAALAVTLAYLVQVTLSHRLVYNTLYEAQVPGRADSPAHHLEQLEAALRLLRERRVLAPATVDHLDLRSVLASGVPVDLPDGKELILGTLSESSTWSGQPIMIEAPDHNPEITEIVAVFRRSRTILPNCHDADRFRPGDQLLIIAPQGSHSEVAEHFNTQGATSS